MAGKISMDLDQGRSVAAMDVGDPLGHRCSRGSSLAQIGVVGADDVIHELGRRQQRRVFAGGLGLSAHARLKLLDHRFRGDLLQVAGLAQRAASLAAEVDFE